MISHAKINSLNLIKRLGLFRISNKVSKKKIKILMYHRFSKKSEPGKLSANKLEEQVKYLKKHYNILTLETVLSLIRSRERIPENCVTITADDGYQDFYHFAYPIFKKYSVPTTVFLTTDFLDGTIWLWHDIINYSLNCSKSKYLNLFLGDKEVQIFLDRQPVDELKKRLFGLCTSVRNETRLDLLKSMKEELKVDLPERPPDEYSPLTWSQVIEMEHNGISFGAHTCTHPVLSRIESDVERQEISKSKLRIEEILQKNVVSFAYPNGKKNDFTEKTKEAVKVAGFFGAVTAIYGLNNQNADVYELRRIAVGGRDLIYFYQDVSGFQFHKSVFYRMISKKMQH